MLIGIVLNFYVSLGKIEISTMLSQAKTTACLSHVFKDL